MADQESIPRRPEEDPGDFEALRGEGIRWIQELSGELWTDYNPHDPGITILEQLCYGLTDLLYRGRFPVADLLASPDGSIDLEGQALHPPEAVFPSRPTTLDDLRRLVLDRVPGVEGVWIDQPPAPGEPEGSPGVGVHRVRLHVDGEGAWSPDEVCAGVRRELYAVRNLGEDLDPRIRILEERHGRLRGQVQIQGGRPPEEILAEIYARSRRHVAGELDPVTGESRTRLRREAELEPWGEAGTLEGALTGPWMEGGGGAGGLVDDGSRVHLADLVALVRDVEGVAAVESLWLEVEGVAHQGSVLRMPPGEDRILCLHVPADGEEDPGIELVRMGRPVAVVLPLLRVRYRELRDAHRLARRGRAGSSLLPHRPRGVNRDDDRYHSVQDHFPAIYGVGERGLPGSASRRERGLVHQLKAYLLPMEQLMANQMSHIRHLRELFSTADASLPTYRYQVLDNEAVPEVEALYLEEPEAVLRTIVQGMDPGGRLRNRVVDHMLAMYGESCNQRSLRQFDHYDRERMDEVVLQNKIAYLRSVITVGRDRGGSFDHTRPWWNAEEGEGGAPGSNVSGFHIRVALLLGLRRPGGRSLVRILGEGEGPGVGSGDGGPGEEAPLRDRPLDGSWERVPVRHLQGAPAPLDPRLSRRLAAGDAALLARGADPAAYRLRQEDGGWVLALQGEEEGTGWPLSTHRDRESGVAAANRLRNAFVELNLECEGFHVVEHILLRPDEGGREHPGADLPEGDRLWSHFHPLRISVFFSGWTARAGDLRYRLLAEETVRINCPAHIHPECHWLDLPSMREFEGLYGSWLQAKADPGAGSSVRDARAAALIRFVLEMQPGGMDP